MVGAFSVLDSDGYTTDVEVNDIRVLDPMPDDVTSARPGNTILSWDFTVTMSIHNTTADRQSTLSHMEPWLVFPSASYVCTTPSTFALADVFLGMSTDELDVCAMPMVDPAYGANGDPEWVSALGVDETVQYHNAWSFTAEVPEVDVDTVRAELAAATVILASQSAGTTWTVDGWQDTTNEACTVIAYFARFRAAWSTAPIPGCTVPAVGMAPGV